MEEHLIIYTLWVFIVSLAGALCFAIYRILKFTQILRMVASDLSQREDFQSLLEKHDVGPPDIISINGVASTIDRACMNRGGDGERLRRIMEQNPLIKTSLIFMASGKQTSPLDLERAEDAVIIEFPAAEVEEEDQKNGSNLYSVRR